MAAGRYSAYPDAPSRSGAKPYFWISKRTVAVALAADKSQLDENLVL